LRSFLHVDTVLRCVGQKFSKVSSIVAIYGCKLTFAKILAYRKNVEVCAAEILKSQIAS